MTLTISSEPTVCSKLHRHSKYWLDDGSLILQTHDHLYKVHRTLLLRHSRLLATLHPPDGLDERVGNPVEGLAVIRIPEQLEVRSADMEVLLEHLYHDVMLDDAASFARLAALFRVSSKQQLDFPSIHALVRARVEALFPARPEAFLRSQHAEAALVLSVQYDIPSIRKPLFYTVATHLHSHDSDPPSASDDAEPPPAAAAAAPADPALPTLPPALAARCDALLESLVAHFTPVLFTVATAGHMACTDVFAEKWMPLVIQPALDHGGLCCPLETLERIIALDWAAEGLCAECVKAKTAEWRGEQRDVWEKIDGWLE